MKTVITSLFLSGIIALGCFTHASADHPAPLLELDSVQDLINDYINAGTLPTGPVLIDRAIITSSINDVDPFNKEDDEHWNNAIGSLKILSMVPGKDFPYMSFKIGDFVGAFGNRVVNVKFDTVVYREWQVGLATHDEYIDIDHPTYKKGFIVQIEGMVKETNNGLEITPLPFPEWSLRRTCPVIGTTGPTIIPRLNSVQYHGEQEYDFRGDLIKSWGRVGDEVDIDGYHFTSTTRFFIGQVTLPISHQNSRSVTVRLPYKVSHGIHDIRATDGSNASENVIQVGVNHKPVIESVGPTPIEPGNMFFIRGRNLTTMVPKNDYGAHRPTVTLSDDEVWAHEASTIEVICGTSLKDPSEHVDNLDPDFYDIIVSTLYGESEIFEMEIELGFHPGPTPIIDRAVVTEGGSLFIFGPNLDLDDVDHHGVYVYFSDDPIEGLFEVVPDAFGGNSIVLKLPDGVTSGEVWVDISDRGVSNRIPFGKTGAGITGPVGGATGGN